jgi:hypothetical protein
LAERDSGSGFSDAAALREGEAVLIVVGLVLARNPPQIGLVPDEGSVQEFASVSLRSSVDQDLRGLPCVLATGSRSHEVTCVIKRKTNRRHMIGDHDGRTARRAALLVRAVDMCGSCSASVLALAA